MATNLSHLRPGDLLIIGNHVVIWLGALDGGTPQVAHAWSGEMGIHRAAWNNDDSALPEVLREYSEQVSAFRCDPLRRAAAQYALAWADRHAPYGSRPGHSRRTSGNLEPFITRGGPRGEVSFKGFSTRYQGVEHEQHQTVPFGFDACYRAVKWAGRTDRALSLKQGHRCDTFAAACYQAAALWNATTAANRSRFAAVADRLKRARAPKPRFDLAGRTAVPDDWKVEHAPGNSTDRRLYVPNAYRGTVNAGPSGSDAALRTDGDAWRLVCTELLGAQRTPDEVFTPALAVDALFTSYTVLKNRCEATGSGWTMLHPLIDDLSPRSAAAAASGSP